MRILQSCAQKIDSGQAWEAQKNCRHRDGGRQWEQQLFYWEEDNSSFFGDFKWPNGRIIIVINNYFRLHVSLRLQGASFIRKLVTPILWLITNLVAYYYSAHSPNQWMHVHIHRPICESLPSMHFSYLHSTDPWEERYSSSVINSSQFVNMSSKMEQIQSYSQTLLHTGFKGFIVKEIHQAATTKKLQLWLHGVHKSERLEQWILVPSRVCNTKTWLIKSDFNLVCIADKQALSRLSMSCHSNHRYDNSVQTQWSLNPDNIC